MKNMTENLQINPIAILHTSGYRNGSEISNVHRRGWLGGLLLSGIILMNSAVATSCDDLAQRITANASAARAEYVQASNNISHKVCSSEEDAKMAEISSRNQNNAALYLDSLKKFCTDADYSQSIVKKEAQKLQDLADKASTRCPLL